MLGGVIRVSGFGHRIAGVCGVTVGLELARVYSAAAPVRFS